MAAPGTTTLQSLSGPYKLNESLSDDITHVLAIQGVNVLLRKTASAAAIHVIITQPSRDNIKMSQTMTSGKIPKTTEEYTLDWEWRTTHDAFFGDVQGRSRWVSVDEGRKTGVVCDGEGEWIEGDSEGMLIEAVGSSKDGKWEAHHLWGFEMVGEERRHTRRVYVTNSDGEEVRVRMVYDFEGE